MEENELFEEEYETKYWINPSDNPEMTKYTNLIRDLKTLDIEFSNEDFEWLKSDERTYKFGYKNNQFHYFVY